MATTEDKKNFAELKEWIQDGWYDNFIPEILELLKSRISSTLEVGQTVIVNDTNSQSKYSITGSEATIIKVNQATVKVKLTKLSPKAIKNKVATVGGVWNVSHAFVSIK